MNLFRSILAGIALLLMTVGGASAQCGTTAPANKFCGNDTGASGLASWKSIPAAALGNMAGGAVLGNRGTTIGPTVPLTNPVLGIPGTSTGEVGLAGATSGTAVLRAQAAAGSAVVLMPTAAGTLVSTASSPLAVNATTGLMTCPTCVTSSGGGAITGTAPISVSAAGVVSINAPYVTLTASNGGIVYSGATNLAILAGTATARQMLQSGASAAPAWSTATWPATTAAGTLLTSASANTVTASATPVLGVAGSTVGSIGFQNATSGTVTLQPVTGALGTVTINIPAAAGTMAVSATAPVTLSAAGAIGCATCLTANQSITLSGDVSGTGATAITTTLATVNANVGTFGSATQTPQFTVNGKGLITAASNVTVTPAVGSITGLGTGVATALGVNIGTAGSFVTNGGALGTPASGVGTNLTALNATQLTSGTMPAARTNGHMNGTATNDNAAAGEVGEYISSTVLVGSAVSLTAGTAANITSISLTAGDWDICGNVAFQPAGSTTQSANIAWISTTSATLPTIPNSGAYAQFSVSVAAGLTVVLNAGCMRQSLSATTTVFLSGLANFAVSTETAYGFIGARRSR